MNRIAKNLIDIYVFVNGMSRESAEEMVSLYDNDHEIEKTIAVYQGLFHSRRHRLNERIPFITIN